LILVEPRGCSKSDSDNLTPAKIFHRRIVVHDSTQAKRRSVADGHFNRGGENLVPHSVADFWQQENFNTKLCRDPYNRFVGNGKYEVRTYRVPRCLATSLFDFSIGSYFRHASSMDEPCMKTTSFMACTSIVGASVPPHSKERSKCQAHLATMP
jgi:hypothetical protein